MSFDQLKRFSQLLAMAALAIFAGLVIAIKGPKYGFALGSLPVIVAIGLFFLHSPRLLGFILLCAFFTNLDVFLSSSLQRQLAFVWVAISATYIGLAYLTRQPRLKTNSPVKLYLLFMLIVTLIVAISPRTRELPLENWIRRGSYSLMVFLLVYHLLTTQKRFRVAVILITWAGVFLAVVNIIEFLDRSLVDFSSLPGRSAGFLINPNASAAAILASFMISYFSPPRFVLIMRLVMFAGIYTTFSRGALLMFWPMVFYQEMHDRKLSLKQILVTLALVVGVITLTIYSTILIEDYSSSHVRKAYARIELMQQGRFEDASTMQRIRVIGINFNRFLEHPILGNGIGSASVNDSPHNMYLLLMAESGVFAILFYLLYLLALFVRLLEVKPVDVRQKLLLIYVYLVTYQLFSHNTLYLRFHVIVAAMLCAAVELHPRRERRFVLEHEPRAPSAAPLVNGLPQTGSTATQPLTNPGS